MTAALITDVEICPSCLNELPAGYEFDHVAIDRAVAGDRRVFIVMSHEEQREVVTTALARGVTLVDLAARLNSFYSVLQDVLPAEHPESYESETARTETVIRQLWEQGLPDVAIAARTGLGPSKVGRVRKRLGLATLPRRRNWKNSDQGFMIDAAKPADGAS